MMKKAHAAPEALRFVAMLRVLRVSHDPPQILHAPKSRCVHFYELPFLHSVYTVHVLSEKQRCVSYQLLSDPLWERTIIYVTCPVTIDSLFPVLVL